MTESDYLISPQEAMTLFGLFKRRSERSPHATAYRYYDDVTSQWRDTSWQEMARSTACWQAALAKENLAVGERVAVMVRNCREWVMFEQAALGLGLVIIPLYVNDRADNVGYILEDAGARVLLIESREQWEALQSIRDVLDKLVRVVCLEALPDVASPNVSDPQRWLPAAGEVLTEVSRAPDDLATIVYTSGTTGRPKGVMLSHRNILWNSHSSLRQFPVYPGDLFLSFLPLSHTLERTCGYYLPMMVGATVAFARSVPLLAEDLLVIRPTALISVPRIYERVVLKLQAAMAEKGALARSLFSLAVDVGWRRFLVAQKRASWSVSLLLWPLLERAVARKVLDRMGGRVRIAVCGGAALPFPVAKVFLGLGLPLIQGYGMTESSPVISGNPLDDNDPASVGTPLPDVEVRIGDNGELLARSPGVMLGYWNNEEATRATIDSAGWLHTGDVAEIRNNHIYITGRLKEIIVLANGEKVPPADMESAIAMDPLFEQVMVIGEAKPYLAVLLVLNRQHWERLRAQNTWRGSDDDLLAEGQVHKAILERLGRLLHAFPGYAQIRRVALTLEPWTVENGLLTPTLKVKRARVVEHMSEAVEELYHGH